MPRVVHCYETNGRPNRVVLRLGDGKTRFSVFTLDEPRRSEQNLRCTVLRGVDTAPPANGSLLLEIELIEIVRLGAPSRMVLQPRRIVGEVQQVLADRVAALSLAAPVENASAFRIRRGEHAVEFLLEVQEMEARGAPVGMGGREDADDALMADLGRMVWAVPTIATTLSSPLAKGIAAFKAMAKRLRISPALLTPILMTSTVALGLGYATWSQHRRAEAAEERSEEDKLSLQESEIAREAAARGEASCLDERVQIAQALGDLNSERAVLAEQALSRSSTLAQAESLGGPRMTGEYIEKVDEFQWQAALTRVVSRMGEIRLDPGVLGDCLAQSELLGQDLPLFVLVWHPVPDQVCPEAYAQILDGVNRAGRFGLSTRAALLTGDGFDAAVEDPRRVDHWSTDAHTTGLRSVLRALLTAQTGSTPPVAPSLANLWALTFWDAYNRFPDRPEGEDQATPEVCVAEAMSGLAKRTPSTEPGAPLLPDIAAFAADKSLLTLPPTAMCPWTAEDLQLGATNALTAAARLALVPAEGLP